MRDPAAQSTRDTEPAAAFTAVDVQAGDPLDQPMLERTAEELSQNAGDLLAGFRGDFVRGRGTEHALLAKSGELTIFKDGAPFASITLGTPLAEDPLQAVKLVDDRLEIVVRHREADRDLLTVCRVIGRAVGRVFEIELDGRVVEFVHLGEERAIRVRGAAEPAVVYRWNPWEGMFRIPAPAPTAPPG